MREPQKGGVGVGGSVGMVGCRVASVEGSDNGIQSGLINSRSRGISGRDCRWQNGRRQWRRVCGGCDSGRLRQSRSEGQRRGRNHRKVGVRSKKGLGGGGCEVHKRVRVGRGGIDSVTTTSPG